MKSLLIFIFFLSASSLSCQDFKIKYDSNQNLYLYQQNFYTFKELKPLVSIHKDSKRLWDKYQYMNLTSSIIGWSGAAILTVGLGIPKDDGETGCDFWCNPTKIYSIFFGSVFTLVGVALGSINSTDNRMRIIDAYNSHYSDDLSENIEKPEFSLIVGNGIGLQVRF